MANENHTRSLARRAFAEFVGTAALVAIVVGSGIAAQRLSPTDPGLQLLENSLATALGLAVLVVVLQPVSGAHLNPLVTLAEKLLTKRLTWREVAVLILAQVAGGLAGTALAVAMYEQPLAVSTHNRAGTGTVLGEIVATAGLLGLIVVMTRTGRGGWVGPAVGAYIGAAYWFTSSTSFANPAVTLARTVTDTFAGIAPASAAWFIGAQVVGAGLGLLAAAFIAPAMTPRRVDSPAGIANA